jgi:Rrf2 family transcriptional regulator, nitric oxide-sensitive transcriptional repressor
MHLWGEEMRLTEWTDYTLRVLMYCGVYADERLVTITEIAEGYGISRNHLMKIVNELATQGVLETTRGRGGGMRLLKPASQIMLGDVIRASEPDFRMVECFDAETNTCTLTPQCRLKRVLGDAMDAYFAVLDQVTLAELLPSRRAMGKTMLIQPFEARTRVRP